MTKDKHNYRERAAQIVIEVAQEAASETRIPRVEEALHLRDVYKRQAEYERKN